jgi:hypothetical protein
LRVFISWSGERAKAVAEALHTWLPDVLAHRVTAFVSSEDIAKGDRGLTKIAEELESAHFGIVVVTAENQNTPWINFEAGALGKSLVDGKVAPLLVGLSNLQLTGPLRQFQNTDAADKRAMFDLVKSINAAHPSEPLHLRTMETLFNSMWDPFADQLEKALASDTTAAPAHERAEADVLNELVETVRSIQRDLGSLMSQQPASHQRASLWASDIPGKARVSIDLQLAEQSVMQAFETLGLDDFVDRMTTSPGKRRLYVDILGNAGVSLNGAAVRSLQNAADIHNVTIAVRVGGSSAEIFAPKLSSSIREDKLRLAALAEQEAAMRESLAENGE